MTTTNTTTTPTCPTCGGETIPPTPGTDEVYNYCPNCGAYREAADCG